MKINVQEKKLQYHVLYLFFYFVKSMTKYQTSTEQNTHKRYTLFKKKKSVWSPQYCMLGRFLVHLYAHL